MLKVIYLDGEKMIGEFMSLQSMSFVVLGPSGEVMSTEKC
jgi:hypothetical protein